MADNVVRVVVHDDEFKNLSKLTLCANLTAPLAQRAANISRVCTGVIQTAAQNGWAKNLSATLLALRQIPVTNASGDDNVSILTQRIADSSLKADSNPDVLSLCGQTGPNCNKTPFTDKEVLIAIDGSGDMPTPAMTPNRAIPISPPLAAMNGFFDGLMNSNNYLGSTPDGKDMSLAETVRDLHTRHPAQLTQDKMQLCIQNDSSVSIKECALEGARSGISFAVDNGLSYAGSKFLGVKQQPSAKR